MFNYSYRSRFSAGGKTRIVCTRCQEQMAASVFSKLVTSSSRLIRYLRSASFHRSIYACTHSRLAVKPGFDPEISFIRPEMLLRLLMEILLSRLPFHVIVDRESNYGLLFFFFFFFLIIAMRFVSFFLLFVPRIGELFLLFPSFFSILTILKHLNFSFLCSPNIFFQTI